MTVLFSIIILHFLAQITPGPDILLIGKIAMTKGKIPAIFSITGITLGIAIWIILTLTGFSLLLSQFTWIQPLIMLFGAVFLAKMGIAMIRSYHAQTQKLAHAQQGENPHPHIDEPNIQQQSNLQYLTQGLFTNLANPKAVIYFASVFSLAIKSPELQSLKPVLAIVVIIETFLVFLALAWALSHPKIQPLYQKNERYIDGIAGLCFVGFALFLAIDGVKGLIT